MLIKIKNNKKQTTSKGILQEITRASQRNLTLKTKVNKLKKVRVKIREVKLLRIVSINRDIKIVKKIRNLETI